MSATSPLIFRPSIAQRTLSVLLCAGSWLVGVRGLFLLVNNLPRLMAAQRQAAAAGEPILLIWVWIVASVTLCVVAGLLLLFSALGLILIEAPRSWWMKSASRWSTPGCPGPWRSAWGPATCPGSMC